MKQKGFSLTELMVVTAVAGIISLFSFESVKGVIKASIGVRKKADFNGLVEEIRGITNKLDQCTCNFQNFPVSAPSARDAIQPVPVLYRFGQTQAVTVGGEPCQGEIEVVRPGVRKYETDVDRVELKNMQYLERMNLLRANLYIEGRLAGDATKFVRRNIPLMFSTEPASGGVNILGCIGMTE